MSAMSPAMDDARAPTFALCAAILLALTAVRLVALRYSVLDLYFDESQYWAWSRELSFGYFSKPPLLAWIIAGAERVCGVSEACIRAPAAVLHLGTSLLIYAIARFVYDARTAFWAALTFAFATGVAFSARIISTDVPLLFFWALALFGFLRLVERPAYSWAVILGLALGFGLLAKYAMVYVLLCAAVAALADRDARALLRTPALWLALALAALIVAPNLWWNLEHGFATFRHVGENIQGRGARLDILKGLEFIATQFAVFAPIAFAVLLFAAVRIRAASRADRLMLAFSLPVLALIVATAFVRGAHPNWAAPAYVSASALVAALLVRHQAWRLLGAGVLIGAVAQVALIVADARADRLTVPYLKQPDIYAPTLGWRALGEEARRLAERSGARTIVGERRYDVASLLYYARDFRGRVLAWPQGAIPNHHFELTRPLATGAAEPILLISPCPSTPRLGEYFAQVDALGSFTAATGPSSRRGYHAFRLAGAHKPIAPLKSCW
jgi:4-amino-4-deoxy-L-arabinose transferase-like glycosyltransferase